MGGVFIKKNEKWKTVEETVSIEQFKNGTNHLLFTSINKDGGYRIKNLKLSVLPKQSSELISLADGSTLYLAEGNGYVKGVVTETEGDLYLQGNLIKTKNGIFEVILPDADKLNSIDYVILDKIGNTISSGSLRIENKVEATYFNHLKDAFNKTYINDLGNEEFAIELDEVSFSINKNNFADAGSISVQRLREIDMAPFGTNVINVTSSRSGYRFLPDGAEFSDNALIGIKYDTVYLPKGYTPNDIKILYFDMAQRRWLSVPTDTLIKEQNKIIAKTTHFTDYIAGVIQAPESPETNSFTPTSIADIQVANPTANIVQIQPPSVNQQGDGTLDFPITIPPGRAGLQPNLAVSYNNNGSSGSVGYGWDINVPVISIDTKYGIPTYDPTYETESYLLNGEELLLVPSSTSPNKYLPHRSPILQTRVSDAVFVTKVESSFSKIIRKGNSPSNYYWEVWDKSGTKYTYGGPVHSSNNFRNSVLRSHKTEPDAKFAKWYLSEVKDKNNNIIQYMYIEREPPTSGVLKDGMEVYVSTITYNKNANHYTPDEENNRGYTITFVYKDNHRGDTQTNYRYGFKENNSRLLDKIHVSCIELTDRIDKHIPHPDPYGSGHHGTILPCENEIEYHFTYNTQAAFAKTLLTKITTKNIKIDMTTGLPAETQQYDHQFQYHSDIGGGLFKSPESIYVDKDFSSNRHAALSSTIEDYTTSEFGFSAGVSLATNPPVWWPFSNSGTINLSFPSPTSSSSSPTMMLMDIDGDGLDDKVMKIGNQIKYRKNLAGMSFSKQLYNAYNISSLGLSENNTKTNPELSFSLLFLNLTSSKSQSNARSRIYFTDVNNDGLIDYVKDKIVYFNRMEPNSGMPSFTDNSNLTPNVILRNGAVDPAVSQGLPDFDIDSGLMDVVKVWVAPKDGNINITGTIIKPFVASHNGVRFSVEHGKGSATLSTYLINPTLLVNAALPTNVSNISVSKGDHIYFRVNSSQLPDDEVIVDWNPRVVYTNGTDGSTFNQAFVYGNSEAVPTVISESGQYRIDWSQSNLNLPSAIQLSVNVYTLNPNNSSAPKVNILTYNQTVTNFLNYQANSLTFNASVNRSQPDTYVYVEIEATGSASLNWKQFDNAFKPKLIKTHDNSFVHIVPKYDMGNAIASELGLGTLYLNWGQFAYKGALPDQNFTPIKKELVSKAKLAGIQNIANPTPNPLMNSQPSIGSVSYNFQTGNFSAGGTTYTVSPDQKEAMEHFMMLRPDREKLAWSAHPKLLVKEVEMSPNYRTDNSNYTPMVPIPSPTGVGIYGAYGVIKEHSSVSQSSNWSMGFYGFALGNGQNKATSTPVNDYMDLNGDGYPDVIGDKIQFTSNKGGLTSNFLNKALLSQTLSNGSGYNAGGSTAHITQTADRNGRFTRIKVGTAASFGGALFETVTAANHVLLDLNGDGLADIVKPLGQVEFNTGTDFVEGSWAGYDKPDTSKTTSQSLSLSIGGDFSGFTRSLVSQSNLDLSFGVSGSQSTTTREKDFVDINGDGLTDYISGNTVKINSGTGFSGIGYNLNKMSESNSFTIGTTLNASVLIPILVPFTIIVIKVGGGGGTSFGKTYNEDNVSLRDFNGDGYPDIVETVSEYEIKVQYSKIGRTNMLKKVINPTGSTIELDYGTQNKISETSIGSTYKMPFKKWVLTGVKVHDGFSGDGENVQEYAFEYFNGFKDRRERKFLGFGEVKTHQLNSSGKVYRTVVQEYLLNDMPNEHIYLPGSSSDSRKYHYIAKLPKKTKTIDGKKRILNEAIYHYAILERLIPPASNTFYNLNTADPVITYHDTNNIVPLLRAVSNSVYHYLGSTSSVMGDEVVSRFTEYDRYGNVTKFEEQVNGMLTNNVQIGYHYLTGTLYDVATPAYHNVNNYQRYSTTALDLRGNITHISRHKDFGTSNSQEATTEFQYDMFGNLTQLTLPKPTASASNAQRMHYNFIYDNFFHKNIVSVTDAQGYNSQTTYNHFGLVTKQKDMNNVEIFNEYDPSLRLIQVKGPYNTGWTIKNEYKVHPATGMYYAVTKHNIKDESVNPGEQVLHTSSFADGLGRIIQTKKELDVEQECGAGSTGYRFAVSGIQIYDEFGRVVESDLSQEQLDCTGNFLNELENYTTLTRDPVLKTTMIYDMQDRLHQSHIHGLNASTFYEFGYGPDHNNIPRYYEKITLPEGNISQTYKDAKGQVVLTKQIDDLNGIELSTIYSYNNIGELLQVTDADNKNTVYQYDTFGQKTQVTHPDSGISLFEYDLTGKLIASTNQNLLNHNTNARIQYQYVFNQLQAINYPAMQSNGVSVPASSVYYTYGGNGAPSYSAGRITSVTDLTGTKNFEYGKLGEVIMEDRILESSVGTMQFVTKYQYDTWGRMINITYPDDEVVTYNYNKVGQLQSIINDSGEYYLKNVTYNFFDQPVQIDYGNDVVTFNSYDLMQRVRSMRLDRPDTTTFMNNIYEYDKNQNIVNIKNGSSQHPLLNMGGISTKNYTYDRFNRLKSAEGIWSGGDNESHDYTLDMAYNNTHGIVNKNQYHQVQSPAFNGLSGNTYNADYEYNDPAHPHAVTQINYSGLEGSQSAVADFTYDANGNIINYRTNYGSFANRDMVWDLQNRLLAVVDDDSSVNHYIYDHTGERTFKSIGSVTQVNIGGAAIHQVLDFNDYLMYPSGYIVVDPGKDEYSKHYYINGKRFASRLESDTERYLNIPAAKGTAIKNSEDNNETQIDLMSMLGVQNIIMGFNLGNTEADCLIQINNIITAYVNMNNTTGGTIQHCVNDINAINNKTGTYINGKLFTACDALIEINAYVCTPQSTNTPGGTPPPSFSAEELLQFDCLTELNILIASYTAAADLLAQQQSFIMRGGGGHKYGCENPYNDLTCCQRYQQTGVWDCPECPDLTPEDCALIPVNEQTDEWKECIDDCLLNSINPNYGQICIDHFNETGEWHDDCFYLLLECDHCKGNDINNPPDPEKLECLIDCQIPGVAECIEIFTQTGEWPADCGELSRYCPCTEYDGEIEITYPDGDLLECLQDCTVRGMSDCVHFFLEFGYWSPYCNNLSTGCECGEEGTEPTDPEDEEMKNCAQDCAHPMATECYQYFHEHGVWMDGCEEIMRDCGCHDPHNELDCYSKALIYIRNNLRFNPNNACEVLAYVQANFNCSPQEIGNPDPAEYFPEIDLPDVDPGSNDYLPEEDGPYPEDDRKPIWWYHTDHLGSSTYLTDNFGRPSHYYETLPFGETAA